MHKFPAWSILIGVSCILALAACVPVAPAAPAAAPAAAGTPVLRVAGGDNGYPSPFAYVRGPGFVRMSFIFDTLVWKDSQGYIPWLATAWQTSPDGKLWTFTLRDGVKWQDGQPLTADDVVFSFDYPRKQQTTAVMVRGLEFVAGVHKTDDRHVEVALSSPYSPFLVNVAGTMPIIPRHIWEKVADPQKFLAPEALIGSGPYRLASYDKTTGAYLYEANPGFWLGQPYVKRIELVPVNDELLSLQQGQIDAASLPSEGGVTDEMVTPFQTDAYGMITAPGEWNPAIHFNISKGAPYSDANFRRAWAYAIDRKEMVQRILLGRGEPGVPSWLAPSNPWRNPNVEKYPFDLAKAKVLLDQVGLKDTNGDGLRELPDGKALNVPLIFDTAGFTRIAELVRDMMKNAGVAVTLKPVDRATMDALTSAGNFEAAITYYGTLGGDPDNLRQNFSSKSKSMSFSRAIGYKNSRFDELAEQQLSASDDTQRKAVVDELQAILAQEVPVLPLYYPTRYQFSRKAVFDAWYYTPGGIGAGSNLTLNKHAFVTGQTTGLKIKGQ